jgi:hypothetical protein
VKHEDSFEDKEAFKLKLLTELTPKIKIHKLYRTYALLYIGMELGSHSKEETKIGNIRRQSDAKNTWV